MLVSGMTRYAVVLNRGQYFLTEPPKVSRLVPKCLYTFKYQKTEGLLTLTSSMQKSPFFVEAMGWVLKKLKNLIGIGMKAAESGNAVNVGNHLQSNRRKRMIEYKATRPSRQVIFLPSA